MTTLEDYKRKCEIYGTERMLYNLFTYFIKTAREQTGMQHQITEMNKRIGHLEVELAVHKHMLQEHGILKRER